MWIEHNENPQARRTIDCTVRAISTALMQDWEITFMGICTKAFFLKDMPSANHVWGAYLRSRGWKRNVIPNECPECYTVKDFCSEHTEGTYILALDGHVVCVVNGDYYDTWDSGDEVPQYYWEDTGKGIETCIMDTFHSSR